MNAKTNNQKISSFVKKTSVGFSAALRAPGPRCGPSPQVGREPIFAHFVPVLHYKNFTKMINNPRQKQSIYIIKKIMLRLDLRQSNDFQHNKTKNCNENHLFQEVIKNQILSTIIYQFETKQYYVKIRGIYLLAATKVRQNRYPVIKT